MASITIQGPTPPPHEANIQSIETVNTPPKSEWMESRRKAIISRRVKNVSIEEWSDLLRISHSVLPKVAVPALSMAVWAALICVFYLVPGVNFLKTLGLPNSTTLITLLGTAMGLLLVFRVNTAYDRFWEGRKVWSTVHYQLRNLGRFIWVFCKPKNQEDSHRQVGAMNLLIAFAAATKHALREEPSHRYTDLGPYVQHLKDFSPKIYSSKTTLPVPMEITLHLQSFLNQYATIQFPSSTSVNALVESLASFQRIKQTPIPAAYRIHLKQTLVVYLLSLPFQLVASPLGWFTIPVTFISSIVMLGIEVIGGEIENPFGYDTNDLPQDEYVDAIREEILQIMASEDPDADSKGWIAPYSLSVDRMNLKQLQKTAQNAIAEAQAKKQQQEQENEGEESFFGNIKGVMDKLIDAVENVGGR
ncbi:Bestrophin, RFP-TM, chloride channel-domain-containing protein [Obelidium mucronatum]|nr:Bestrophin, RFP-TM, chloride channel-domain-containing protein [Obelidium mucronatum]